MDRKEKDKVINMIKECSPLTEIKILEGQTRLLDDLEFDSMSIIELFLEIENKFDIPCRDFSEMYQALESLDSLLDFIENRMAEVVKIVVTFPWNYDEIFSSSIISLLSSNFSGFKYTVSEIDQSLVSRDQRSGFLLFASS